MKLSELLRIHQIQREVSGLQTTPSSSVPGIYSLHLAVSFTAHTHPLGLYISVDRISCSYHYITCHFVRRFYPKRLTYIQYCGQSPQEQFGVKCLAQGHNDMLTAVGLELATP